MSDLILQLPVGAGRIQPDLGAKNAHRPARVVGQAQKCPWRHRPHPSRGVGKMRLRALVPRERLFSAWFFFGEGLSRLSDGPAPGAPAA